MDEKAEHLGQGGTKEREVDDLELDNLRVRCQLRVERTLVQDCFKNLHSPRSH